jgi:hypothetical protein
MASTAIRERRRTLRYRNLLVRQMLQMKIKISALLMEAGVSYNKQRLHKAGYSAASVQQKWSLTVPHVPPTASRAKAVGGKGDRTAIPFGTVHGMHFLALELVNRR